eukprot:CAMPEP_0115415176 /NCGR_PEP_ID=MMETSP0271-20121206/22962_1 /TAXON_ID=71861 /ORGANISM="Scrippsiella trochoidea, Strain CCMP3099" /LENGTH=256 /DNA_ID=CAMNT_0002839501 /DNA_START=51 /DNA_END=822 /DNA_ORIENTATION=+
MEVGAAASGNSIAAVNAGGFGEWRLVLDSLQSLENRQAAARAELQSLHRKLQNRAEAAAAVQAVHEQEIAGLRAAQAAAVVQFERRSRALAAHASRARQMSSRARTVSLKARVAVQQARADAEAAEAQVQAANSVLAARAAERTKLRARVEELERKLEAQSLLGRRQATLLDDAAEALRDICSAATPAAAAVLAGSPGAWRTAGRGKARCYAEHQAHSSSSGANADGEEDERQDANLSSVARYDLPREVAPNMLAK